MTARDGDRLTTADAAHCGGGAGECHLCGDEAIVGRVIALDTSARTASVALPDGVATVALDLVDAAVGDSVLVHLGFAIERLESV